MRYYNCKRRNCVGGGPVLLLLFLIFLVLYLLNKAISYYLIAFGLLHYLLEHYNDDINADKAKKYAISAFKKRHNLK